MPLAGQRDLMAHAPGAAGRRAASDRRRPRPIRPRDPRDTPLDDVVAQRDARVAATGEEPVATEEPDPR